MPEKIKLALSLAQLSPSLFSLKFSVSISKLSGNVLHFKFLTDSDSHPVTTENKRTAMVGSNPGTFIRAQLISNQIRTVSVNYF